MKLKKTKRADLEKKRPLFVEIGFIIALLLVLIALGWKFYEREEYEIQTRERVDIIEEVILQTEQKVKLPPPKTQVTTTILNIVEDDVVVEEEIEINVEADQETEVAVEAPEPVVMEEEEEIKEAEIFLVVEEQPTYPGGEEARLKFLRKNLKYPQLARESGIQGSVYLQFVVEPDGSISNIRIVRGIGGGCDEEAIRVVKLMPKWKAGKQRGKAVRVNFTMPIKFVLTGG